jgi:hypothetical protein
MPNPRTITTADALRMLEYSSPLPGWHSHGGRYLIPTDSCASCNELKRRAAERDESAPNP